ncbi:hypothetical protein [Carnimonas bestiolae]|uniref:hypothetical protein n=1 Tax=Carnimonas bestiolae TaxID=3402172 RepID=UPI003EDC6DFB
MSENDAINFFQLGLQDGDDIGPYFDEAFKNPNKTYLVPEGQYRLSKGEYKDYFTDEKRGGVDIHFLGTNTSIDVDATMPSGSNGKLFEVRVEKLNENPISLIKDTHYGNSVFYPKYIPYNVEVGDTVLTYVTRGGLGESRDKWTEGQVNIVNNINQEDRSNQHFRTEQTSVYNYLHDLTLEGEVYDRFSGNTFQACKVKFKNLSDKELAYHYDQRNVWGAVTFPNGDTQSAGIGGFIEEDALIYWSDTYNEKILNGDIKISVTSSCSFFPKVTFKLTGHCEWRGHSTDYSTIFTLDHLQDIVMEDQVFKGFGLQSDQQPVIYTHANWRPRIRRCEFNVDGSTPGKNKGPGSTGINAFSDFNAVIEDCRFKGFWQAINLQGTSNPDSNVGFVHCVVRNCYNDGGGTASDGLQVYPLNEHDVPSGDNKGKSSMLVHLHGNGVGTVIEGNYCVNSGIVLNRAGDTITRNNHMYGVYDGPPILYHNFSGGTIENNRYYSSNNDDAGVSWDKLDGIPKSFIGFTSDYASYDVRTLKIMNNHAETSRGNLITVDRHKRGLRVVRNVIIGGNTLGAVIPGGTEPITQGGLLTPYYSGDTFKAKVDSTFTVLPGNALVNRANVDGLKKGFVDFDWSNLLTPVDDSAVTTEDGQYLVRITSGGYVEIPLKHSVTAIQLTVIPLITNALSDLGTLISGLAVRSRSGWENSDPNRGKYAFLNAENKDPQDFITKAKADDSGNLIILGMDGVYRLRIYSKYASDVTLRVKLDY